MAAPLYLTTAAALPHHQPPLPTLPTGIAPLDALLGGLPRGALSELSGPCGSGRTTLLHSLLAQATRQGELVALVDPFHAFDPLSAARAGVQLDRLLWIRTQADLPAAFKAADLVVHAGGFGIVCLDLSGAPPKLLQHVPLSYWFRFQRAVHRTPAMFLVVTELAQASLASTCWLEFEWATPIWSGTRPFRLLQAMRFQTTLKKPGSPRTLCWEAQVE